MLANFRVVHVTDASPLEVRNRFIDELWNGRRLQVAHDLYSPDAITHQLRSAPGPQPAARRSPDDLIAELERWFKSFPDVRISVEQTVCDGDLVTSRYVFTGRQTGEWHGIPPTNRSVTIRMTHTIRVERGLVVEDWLLADWYGMLQQLGLLPTLEDLFARARSPN